MSSDSRRTAPSSDIESFATGVTQAAMPVSRRIWVEHQGRYFEVRAVPLVIGRSGSCQIVLDDALASRRHAQLRLLDGRAVIEDLGSINGVLVNGERIGQPTVVIGGDRIGIGRHVLVVSETSVASPSPGAPRLTAETLSGVDAVRLLGKLDDDIASESEGTQQASSLDLLTGLAEKALSLGRGEEAERIVSNFLRNLLVSAQRQGTLEPVTVEKAARLALRLASATQRGAWVDYAFAIHRVVKRPLPAEQVDELYSLIRTVPGWSLAELRGLLAELREHSAGLGPAERFLLQRLEGLERIAGAI